jgi:hypothetical protein
MGSFIVILLHHARAGARAVNDNERARHARSVTTCRDLYLPVPAITIRSTPGEKYRVDRTAAIPRLFIKVSL